MSPPSSYGGAAFARQRQQSGRNLTGFLSFHPQILASGPLTYPGTANGSK